MSQKRKLEEYHDPDYPQPILQSQLFSTTEQPKKKSKPHTCVPVCLSEEDRRDKVCTIIRREFQTELKAKEQEIDQIEKRIGQARQLLAKVRYAVVHSYYTKKNLAFSEQEVKQFDEHLIKSEPLAGPSGGTADNAPLIEEKKYQPAIHPSLKKILGKRPLDYNEILKVRPTREAAKTATQRFIDLKKQPASTKLKIVDMTYPAEPAAPEVSDPNTTAATTTEVIPTKSKPD